MRPISFENETLRYKRKAYCWLIGIITLAIVYNRVLQSDEFVRSVVPCKFSVV